MGTIKNTAAKGDPAGKGLYVAEFASLDQVTQYLKENPGFNPPPAQHGSISLGETYQFAGSPWVIFYSQEGGPTIVRSITQCFEDIALNVGSIGNQLLLSYGK